MRWFRRHKCDPLVCCICGKRFDRPEFVWHHDRYNHRSVGGAREMLPCEVRALRQRLQRARQ